MHRFLLALALSTTTLPLALAALESLSSALAACADYAAALEHDALPVADDDRRLLAKALADADEAFAAVIEHPGALSPRDAGDVWTDLGEAERALHQWSEARAVSDRRAMRSAARRAREAIDRAAALVSGAEAAAP